MVRVFYENVLSLIPRSRFRSREDLSAQVFDGKRKYLANAHKKGQIPSLERASKIAGALGVKIDDLLKEDMHDLERKDLFVEILVATSKSKSIADLGKLIDHVDLYHPVKPNDLSLNIYKVGKQSLSSRILERSAVSNMRTALRSASVELDAKFRAAYSAAAGGIPMISVETLNIKILVPPFNVSTTYIRLLIAVKGLSGEDLVLNYSYPLTVG